MRVNPVAIALLSSQQISDRSSSQQISDRSSSQQICDRIHQKMVKTLMYISF
ncbi:MAG: hypothetical protein HUM72_22640 [Dolichospermum sp.]|nr:hypothetical protein [Dolichospermum sp. DET66]MBS3036068.1 hypothetical protein [Dolichospermum sp. DET67]MCS6283352.1 hypothetical protein [Dolichospermum sp.]